MNDFVDASLVDSDGSQTDGVQSDGEFIIRWAGSAGRNGHFPSNPS